MQFVMFFTLRESRGYRISFVVKGSQYVTTASPLTPRICSILDFCSNRVRQKARGKRLPIFLAP